MARLASKIEALEQRTGADLAPVVVFELDGKTFDRSPWVPGARELTGAEVQAIEGKQEVIRIEYVHNWRDPERGTA